MILLFEHNGKNVNNKKFQKLYELVLYDKKQS